MRMFCDQDMNAETCQKPRTVHRNSSEISAVLTGNAKQSSHYCDELERFQRNFADHDKVMRSEEKSRKENKWYGKQMYRQAWQERVKNYEDEVFADQNIKNGYARYLYQMGSKKTAHTNGLPINPITMNYDNNPRGLGFKQSEQEHKVKDLVRAHNLQKRGNSGFNVINGQDSVKVTQMVRPDMKPRLEEKLTQFYGAMRLRPLGTHY